MVQVSSGSNPAYSGACDPRRVLDYFDSFKVHPVCVLAGAPRTIKEDGGRGSSHYDTMSLCHHATMSCGEHGFDGFKTLEKYFAESGN